MIRRFFNLVAVWYCWVLLLSVALMAGVIAFGLRPHRVVAAAAATVCITSLLGYMLWHDLQVARASWWTWRWWWWGKRTGRWLRRRDALRAAGRCPTCGYDLTGNVSGVCPECGKETT